MYISVAGLLMLQVFTAQFFDHTSRIFCQSSSLAIWSVSILVICNYNWVKILAYILKYHIAGNFRRTLFSEISKTSGIFQNFFMKWCFKVFQVCSKKEKMTENFENIFLKYWLKKFSKNLSLQKFPAIQYISLLWFHFICMTVWELLVLFSHINCVCGLINYFM